MKKKLVVFGYKGMVGSAIHRSLTISDEFELIGVGRKEVNLVNQQEVESFFADVKPEFAIIAAAKVGGILANNIYRADFIYSNLMIEANIIHSAYTHGTEKLLFLGSSCIYPKFAPQPMKEEHLLTGELEYTNEPYAIAKIAGIKLCENYYKQYGSNFFSIMPTNLYGINDNFDLQTSHVLPALLRKFHEAKINDEPSVTVWGSGRPMREFLYVDDLADAVKFLINKINASDLYDIGLSHLNVGTGKDITIAELASTIKEIVGYDGDIIYDSSKPDGTPRKLMDVSRLKNLGWQYKTELDEGIKLTYKWYLER